MGVTLKIIIGQKNIRLFWIKDIARVIPLEEAIVEITEYSESYIIKILLPIL